MKGYIKSPLGAMCVSRYQMAYPEPDMLAFEGDKPSTNQDLLSKLLTPNPWMSQSDFSRYSISYQLYTGNCYWLKARKGKKFMGWFPFHDSNITPFGESGMGGAFIAGYKFITYDGYEHDYAPEDVVHMPWVYMNPLYPNRGISPAALADILVDTDSKLDQHIAAFISNNARPDGVLRLDPRYAAMTKAVTVSKVTTEKLISAWKKRFQNNRSGEVGALPPGWEFQAIGSSLGEMALDQVRLTPGARTCALYLIPPEVAGDTSGLAHSTENNLAESRVRWTTNTLVPLWKFNASKFTAGIQQEYPGVTIKYDFNNVGSMREMANATLAGQAQQLSAFVTGVSTGQMDGDMARAAMQYAYNMTDEQALKIIPKQPPRSATSVDANGELINADGTNS